MRLRAVALLITVWAAVVSGLACPSVASAATSPSVELYAHRIHATNCCTPFMLKPWTVVIALHAIVAAAAVVMGGFQLVRTVRGDQLHKAAGRLWGALMLVVSVTGFFIGGYSDGLGIFLHALAAWTIISVCAGIYFARKGLIAQHKGFMLGAYFGLLGALVGVIAVRTRRVPSYFCAYPVTMTFVTAGIIAVCGFVILALSVRSRARGE